MARENLFIKLCYMFYQPIDIKMFFNELSGDGVFLYEVPV